MNPNRKVKFAFGVAAAETKIEENKKKRLLVSDYKSHSVMETDELILELNIIVGQHDTQDLMMDLHKVLFLNVL